MFDRSEDAAHAKGNGQTAQRPGDFVCAGEDLKDMLAMLSRQFVEADQRNAAALTDMRGRLANLGRSAECVREQMPEQYAPAFSRIEDGVQQLAERMAAVGREREAAKAAAMIGPVEPAPAGFREEVGFAPVNEPRAHVVAPAEPAQSAAGNAADPWDREAADALARLYDSGDARMTAEPLIESLAAPVPMFAAVAQVAATAPDADGASQSVAATHADREWLEERFAAIAVRVEQSLAEMRPDNALLAFDGRLEQLEHRFGAALEEVATRADVEGLRIIEAHINELSSQFERTQGQLGRLDHIEAQLGDLLHQVSDERFVQLVEQLAPAPAAAAYQGPTEEDIEVVAMAVADRVASRMPQSEAQNGAESGSIGDLKRIVENFVSGQRETEEHTTTMLDTMQQAMIRMLDRMDALEQSAPAYGSSQPNFAPSAPAPMAYASATAPAMSPQARVEPAFVPQPVEPEAEAPRVATARVAPQNKEDFRAAAVADARRAARKVATQAGEPIAAAAAAGSDVPRTRRGAPAVEISPPAAEPEVKQRSRMPLMVAGIALVAAVGLLAASIGFNRSAPSTGIERQTAQKKAPLTVDNGSMETTAGELAGSVAGSTTPTPPIEGNSAPRPAPTAAPGTAPRPGAALGDPRNQLRSNTDAAVEGQDAIIDATIAQPDATVRAPGANALGISVTPTNNAVPANSDLARMRQQRNMASLASQLAAVQANAPTVPASMMPDGARVEQASATVAEVSTEAATPAEMPPAQIGPNSLRLAAQKGDPSAEFEVAARFAEGRGVAQDFKQANLWYGRAAQRGFAPAQYRLGTLYERGIGTKADVVRAKIWYGRAAEQGHVKAMHNLAVLNAGREQSADYAMAVQWFTAAAERGLADSQYNLGVLYESGLGLPRDMKLAYHWLSLAALAGDKEAGRRSEQVRMKLEEADVAAVEAGLNSWRAKSTDPQVNEARAAGEAWKQRQAAAR